MKHYISGVLEHPKLPEAYFIELRTDGFKWEQRHTWIEYDGGFRREKWIRSFPHNESQLKHYDEVEQ